MVDDAALGDLHAADDKSGLLESLFHKSRETAESEERASLDVFESPWSKEKSGYGYDLPHSLVITHRSQPDGAFHLTHLESIGLTVDFHDSWDSALWAQGALRDAGGGGLLLHGAYSTDGEAAYRLGERIEEPQFVRAGHLAEVPGIREWLVHSPVASGEAVVGMLLPELHAEALVSYSLVATLTGLKLQTLRNYVHRAEGAEIPFRQFSTEQGHPQWSRPVMAEWAGYRVNPRYSIDCRPFDGVIRAEQNGEGHPHIDVGDYSHEEAKEAVESGKLAAAATGYRLVGMPKGFRVQDHNGEVPFDDLNPVDFEGVSYSMQISEAKPGPVTWP